MPTGTPHASSALFDDLIVYPAGPRDREAIEDFVARLSPASRYLRFLHALRQVPAGLLETLLRFDPVYHYHFKCNLSRLRDYPALYGFLRDVYQTGGVASTCNLEHVKHHYYTSHPTINPNRIVPLGPPLDLLEPHERNALG